MTKILEHVGYGFGMGCGAMLAYLLFHALHII